MSETMTNPEVSELTNKKMDVVYPLVNIQKAIENYHILWIYPLKMVIFHN
jgi:hypothetical protein